MSDKEELLNCIQDLYGILIELKEKGVLANTDYINHRLKWTRKLLSPSGRTEKISVDNWLD